MALSLLDKAAGKVGVGLCQPGGRGAAPKHRRRGPSFIELAGKGARHDGGCPATLLLSGTRRKLNGRRCWCFRNAAGPLGLAT